MERGRLARSSCQNWRCRHSGAAPLRRGGKNVAQCVSTGNSSARTSSPSGAKERTKDSYAPNGARRYGQPFPRLTPWATIFRPSGPENVETPVPAECRRTLMPHWSAALISRQMSAGILPAKCRKTVVRSGNIGGVRLFFCLTGRFRFLMAE